MIIRFLPFVFQMIFIGMAFSTYRSCTATENFIKDCLPKCAPHAVHGVYGDGRCVCDLLKEIKP